MRFEKAIGYEGTEMTAAACGDNNFAELKLPEIPHVLLLLEILRCPLMKYRKVLTDIPARFTGDFHHDNLQMPSLN